MCGSRSVCILLHFVFDPVLIQKIRCLLAALTDEWEDCVHYR